MPFPPTPRYPKAIDSDKTLFLVHNTAETKICEENPAWAQEIEIIPVKEGELEIWADNGFANISGELFYYDSVSKNEHGKVHRLKGCARNLGGEKTTWNARGTWVRGYVVAEHHNQLVDTILKMQDFTGINFDTRQRTLDWRIRNLQNLEAIYDDFSCPDIDFTFNTSEISKEAGILATYSVVLSSVTAATSFRLDFGDGEFTTTELSGTHRYAINARIDPVVTVSNDKCQIIQTPVERDNPAEPPAPIVNEFEFPVPVVPDVPPFIFVPCDVPEPNLNIPPVVLPCPPDTSFSIVMGDINITPVSFTPIGNFTSIIIVEGIPSFIDIPFIPPTITIDPPIPPTIIIIPPDSDINLNLNALDLPQLNVNWQDMPDMHVKMTMVRPIKESAFSDDVIENEFGVEFADVLEAQKFEKIQYEEIEFPSEIQVIMPEFKKIQFEELTLPNIKVDVTELQSINLKISGPDINSINLIGQDIPEEIELVYKGPTSLKLETTTIDVVMEKDIPDRIIVEVPEISIDASSIPRTITLEGNTIELVVPENVGIPVVFPEVIPQMEVVYKAAPVELKITMDDIISNNGCNNPVMIVPCPRS